MSAGRDLLLGHHTCRVLQVRRNSKQKYAEGDWFAVPLEGGGFALGLAARVNPKGGVLGFFFGPKLVELPASVEHLDSIDAQDALLIGRFGDLGLISGRWPVIGSLPTWDRASWKPPLFGRHEELTGLSWAVRVDNDDPMELVEETIAPALEVNNLPDDGLLGSGAVEALLSHMLKR